MASVAQNISHKRKYSDWSVGLMVAESKDDDRRPMRYGIAGKGFIKRSSCLIHDMSNLDKTTARNRNLVVDQRLQNTIENDHLKAYSHHLASCYPHRSAELHP
jgi:hypothetical protein